MKGVFLIALGLIVAVAMLFTADAKIAYGATGGEMIEIRIGTNKFTALLEDNAATGEFLKQLPLTLQMRDMNGNEKYAYLPAKLPTDSSTPRTIYAGDLMLYGDSTLVLFYETFRNSYSYTRLGSVGSPAELKAALRGSNISVEFRGGRIEK